MVKSAEKRTPEYCLTTCQQAVAARQYRLSRAADNYIADSAAAFSVPFSVLDLEKFISTLTPECFSKAIKYDNVDRWWDVYIADYRIPYINEIGEPADMIIKFYLKFFLRNDIYKVEIVSFHESR